MSCYHPIKGYRTPHGVVFSELRRHDILGDIEIPCGQCIGCRMRRASDWELRVMHEASMWKSNCFVTLTYGQGCLPPNGSLEHRDFQLFIKRARKELQKNLRYYMCGEYGPEGGRPHYHACIFNEDFRRDWKPHAKSKSGALMYTSETLTRLWGHGFATVQDLCRKTAGYTARYIMKKTLGEEAKGAYDFVDENGEIRQRKPEYAAMSLKPGIGAAWYNKYKMDIVRGDKAIAEGQERRVPKYYDKLLAKQKDVRKDEIDYNRYQKGKEGADDQTDERRAVREEVHKARVRNLKREL